MIDDAELLQRYVNGSEAAFTEFVQRHVNHVFAAALRRLGNDRPLAEDVTQIVFTQCALKAKTLQSHPALSGWLHRSTRFAAIDCLRAKRRRIATEETALMSLEVNAASTTELDASEIRPVIDPLLDRLGTRERDAVTLRFFDGCSFAQIGARLRISEDAARMRVERALEKLHQALVRRGLHSTTAALGLALGAGGAAAAPVGLAGVVSASALATATAAGGGGLAAGTFFLMTKAKIGILSTLVAVGLTAVVFESKANLDLADEAAAFQQSVQPVQRAERRLPLPISSAVTATDAEREELARLRARAAELKARPDGVVDAEILERSAWRNAGYATPEAAFQTFIWAGETGDTDTLAKSFSFGDGTKAEADAYFATLSVEQRELYGTPERLLAPFLVARPTKFKVEAVQVIDLLEGDQPDEKLVRYWVRTEDGGNHVDTLPFRRVGDRWLMGSRQMGMPIAQAVEFVRARIEPRVPSYVGGKR